MCVHFYELFASTPIDLSFLRVQNASADDSRFLMEAGHELADAINSTLAGIRSNLKAKGAEYPILRVFASWPGEAMLKRSMKRRKKGRSMDDPDPHPLACLEVAKFTEISQEFGQNRFTGQIEREILVSSKKRPHESERSDVRKRLRSYQNPSA